ncbi:CCND2 [Lepeophtheirus salmonis]|uniref:CCND2 n=1 Tax=Lepeophtheirus salmonis TaxID=72036 RepID=A0A0K2TLK2_LEPSM|nr:G1/S-specific cyclin-D3-like [Lepeophtheirus salmonis]CAB4064452.1 CCND2 [Lepeophtheirus salmonis]CAF2941806.1 CCND2 [Lepeophtheirus salmonis]
MDFLLCDETSEASNTPSPTRDDMGIDGIKSYEDPALIGDLRVLRNVLQTSTSSSPVNYIAFQNEVTTSMRKIVTDWMLEVCEEENCHGEVFHLAVNYLDRFLCATKDIKKSNFQLLACACIFLASKFKETSPIIADKLSVYTDFAFSTSEITEWELCVLSVLGWDLSIITPYTVLDQIMRRINGVESCSFDMDTIRRHAETFIALSATEYEFYLAFEGRPTVLAVGALIAAFSGFATSDPMTEDIASDLCELTGINGNEAFNCGRYIEEVMSRRITEARNASGSPSKASTTSRYPSNKETVSASPSTTPTDLMEISHSLVC